MNWLLVQNQSLVLAPELLREGCSATETHLVSSGMLDPAVVKHQGGQTQTSPVRTKNVWLDTEVMKGAK